MACKKYCRLCKKRETKEQCSYGPKMWSRFTVDDPTDKEMKDAADDAGITNGDGGDGGGMGEEFITLPLNIEIPTDIRDFNLGLMFRESLDINSGMLFIFDEVTKQSFHMRETRIPLDIAFIDEDGIIESIKKLEPFSQDSVFSEGNIICALEVNSGWFAENNIEVGDEIDIEEGKKDACYHEVKSRYSVWPSAYASGALVKCRKKGAKNWGNKSEGLFWDKLTEGFRTRSGDKTKLSQSSERKTLGRKSSTKVGSKPTGYESPKEFRDKSMPLRKHRERFGDLSDDYNFSNWRDDFKVMEYEFIDLIKPKPIKGEVTNEEKIEEAVRIPAVTGNLIDVYLNWKGKYLSLKLFFPDTKMPKKSDIQDQIEKVYPSARVQNYMVTRYKPGEQFLRVEESLTEKSCGDGEYYCFADKKCKPIPDGMKVGKNGMLIKEEKSPAWQRKSFCSRMKGMKAKLTSTKTARDPDSRINK